jgi:hypothetical protein
MLSLAAIMLRTSAKLRGSPSRLKKIERLARACSGKEAAADAPGWASWALRNLWPRPRQEMGQIEIDRLERAGRAGSAVRLIVPGELGRHRARAPGSRRKS